MLLALLYALLVGLGLLLTKVIEHSWLIREEDGVNRALEDGRTPTMNDVTYLLSGLGNTQAIIGAMVIVAIALRLASRSMDACRCSSSWRSRRRLWSSCS